MVVKSTKIYLYLVDRITKYNFIISNYLITMDKIIEKSIKSIQSVHFPYQRDVIGKINWDWRMNGIVGAIC